VAEPVVVAELVEVKPPSSLALFCGHFDASTSSATTSSMTITTRILSKKVSQNYKQRLFDTKICCKEIRVDEN